MDANKIIIGVYGQDGVTVGFRVKRNRPMRKLLMKYCKEKKLDYPSTDFLYKRRRVPVRSTPDELRMKNGDQIDALVRAYSA